MNSIQCISHGQKPTTHLPSRLNYCQGGTKFARFLVASIIAQAAATQPYHLGENGPSYTNSKLVGIDNRCSACISHNRADFPGKLTKCTRPIKGFGGTKHFEVWTGTLHWRWDDDHRKQHSFTNPKSYYIPTGKVRLLSPQHWAQTRSGKNHWFCAGETMTALNTMLFWNDGTAKCTVPIDREGNNVATF